MEGEWEEEERERRRGRAERAEEVRDEGEDLGVKRISVGMDTEGGGR